MPLQAALSDYLRVWHCTDHDDEDDDEDEDEGELEDADLAVLAKHGLTRKDFHNLVCLAETFVPLFQDVKLHRSAVHACCC